MSSAQQLLATESLLYMIYLYVCTLGRSALGKAPKLEIITAVSSLSSLSGVHFYASW